MAVFSISCKDKPTQTSDFSGFNDNLSINTNQGFTQFLGKTIRSRDALESTGSYFWAEFTQDGIKYGAGGETSKPNPYSSTVGLSKDALGTNSKANFTGSSSEGTAQSGSITFENNGDVITKVGVSFTSGTSYDGQTFDCQYLN